MGPWSVKIHLWHILIKLIDTKTVASLTHYSDVIMSAMMYQTTSLTIVYSWNRLFMCRSKTTSKLRVTGLCEGNSPVTGEFPAQRAGNAENVFIWWRHHGPGNLAACSAIFPLVGPQWPKSRYQILFCHDNTNLITNKQNLSSKIIEIVPKPSHLQHGYRCAVCLCPVGQVTWLFLKQRPW